MSTLDIADAIMMMFVKQYAVIYGKNSVTSNVHNLVHVTDDVRNFGPLPSISAYPFENKLFSIKKLLRKGNDHLAQAAKRISEISIGSQYTYKKSDIKYPELKKKIRDENVDQFFSEVALRKDLILNNKFENKWFLTKNNDIIQMDKVKKTDNSILIYGKQIISPKFDLFELPIRSSLLNIFVVNDNYCCNTESNVCQSSQIKCKLFPIMDKKKKIGIYTTITYY